MTRDPWAEVRSDPRLLPDPELVDLDAIVPPGRVVATFDEDGWLLADLFGLVTTVIPREDFL